MSGIVKAFLEITNKSGSVNQIAKDGSDVFLEYLIGSFDLQKVN